jgi:nucleotide-binding universal stress UspA family protein
MFPVKTVLCPTDFSEPSQEALKIARELASQVGAGLLLVHVVPVLPALPNDPNYVLKVPEYERLLHQDADEIVRIAEIEKADLIVIATHGTTGWRRFMFGSVADKVVRLAKCPVLTIRNPQEEGT